MVVSAEQRRDVDYGHGVDVGELLAGRRYRDEAAVEGVPNVVSEQAEVVDLPEPCESGLIFEEVSANGKSIIDTTQAQGNYFGVGDTRCFEHVGNSP